MATGTNPLQRAAIAVQATGPGARLQAPGTNSALELAASLRGLAPEVNTALQGYAEDEQKRYAAKARKDALETSGAKLADAVREGRIEATQNPWYMQAYAREGAAIRAQRDFADLAESSASWEQQNDPKAFEQRWRAEVGAITEQYEGQDEIAGFAPVESQFTQQALQSNQAKNVKRIETERVDNLTSLASSALADLARTNGGTLTPAQAVAALQSAKEMWFGTGGDVGRWHDMVEGAITTAARKTDNAGLLDLIQDPSLIGGESDQLDRSFGDGASSAGEARQEGAQVPVAAPSPAVAPKAAPRWSSEQLAAVAKMIPGAKVTSMGRSRKHNAEVNGVPDSQHIEEGGKPATALDILAPGMSKAQVEAVYAKAGAQVTVLQHDAGSGMHFHIQGAKAWKPSSTSSQQASSGSMPLPSLVPAGGSTSPESAALAGAATSDFPRGPSLYDMPGVAERIEQAKYYIGRQQESAQVKRLQAYKQQIETGTMEAVDLIYSTYGTAALKGEVGADTLIGALQAKGYSGQVIGNALASVRQDVGASQGLAAARFQANDPTKSTQLFDLQVRGRTGGYSAGYEQEVASAVMRGDLTREDGAAMVSAAVSRTEQLNAGVRREEASQAKAGVIVQSVSDLRERVAPALVGLADSLARKQNIIINPRLYPRMKLQMIAQMEGYLATHPGDLDGAYNVGQLWVVDFMRRVPASTKWGKSGSGQGGGGQGTKPVASTSETKGRPSGNPRG